jgi:PhnO protein
MTKEAQLPPEQQVETLMRGAHEADLPDIYRMLCQLEEHELDFDVFRQKFLDNLQNPGIHYIVATQADKAVGFISLHVQQLLHHDGGVGEIQELIVDPNIRSQGIGRQLVDQVRQVAIDNNCESLEVTTNVRRERTKMFYEKNGLTPSHVKLTEVLSPKQQPENG